MSENERRILEVLADSYYSDFGCFPFAPLAESSGVPLRLVRRTVRSLARKGFAECVHGLWTEEGTPAGSGYACTKAGLAEFNRICPPVATEARQP